MSPVERYLAQLAAALHVTGAPRRRFLAECADHLREAAEDAGEDEAVARFGSAREIALAFDAEAAAARGARATVAALTALALGAASVIGLAHLAGPHAGAPTPLAIAFFVSAQVAAVAAGIAVVQTLRWRRRTPPAAVLTLLARRNAIALVAGGVTLLSTAWSIGGAESVVLVGGGLLACCAALWTVRRAGRLARTLPGSAEATPESPFADLEVLGARVPGARAALRAARRWVDPVGAPVRCCTLVCLLAAWAAFARDQGEGASTGGALVTAAIEAGAVVACFAALGPPLGLRVSD